MTKKTFTVSKISCGHCVMAIKNKLNALEGIKSVTGEPENKSVTMEWEEPATEDKIRDALKAINYPAD